MAKTIQKQQRFPEPLLILIDQWAKGSGMDRTAAVNHMCRCFLEAIEVEGLRRECSRLTKEAAELRGKVVALAMEGVPKDIIEKRSLEDSWGVDDCIYDGWGCRWRTDKNWGPHRCESCNRIEREGL